MTSIVNSGIFTGQGLIAFVFLAFGFFLFYKGKDKSNPYIRTDKRIYISAVMSLIIGLVFLVIYIIQIKDIVVY